MHMIGHQAARPNLRSRLLHPLREKIKIERVVTFLKEGLLATVTTLRNVMRDAGENDTGKAGHMLSELIDAMLTRYHAQAGQESANAA